MEKEASNLFFEIVRAIWQKYGPFAALLVLVVATYQYLLWKVWTGRLRDKDAEIERVVKSRNRLEDVLLKNRRSSRRKK